MSRRGQVFTPKTVDVVRGLAKQGKSAPEIAKAIGSTAASVRVRCSQLKIKLNRRGRPTRQQTRPPDTQDRKIVLYVCPAVHADLNQRAARMQKSSVELVRMLLEAIVDGNIYDAVLDEERE
jgi:hypothetical protein